MLVQREEIRYSPAGVPLLVAVLAHSSEQPEAGVARKIDLELSAVFAGKVAQAAARLDPGCRLTARGFLAPRRRQSKLMALHVTEFEIIEV